MFLKESSSIWETYREGRDGTDNSLYVVDTNECRSLQNKHFSVKKKTGFKNKRVS